MFATVDVATVFSYLRAELDGTRTTSAHYIRHYYYYYHYRTVVKCIEQKHTSAYANSALYSSYIINRLFTTCTLLFYSHLANKRVH